MPNTATAIIELEEAIPTEEIEISEQLINEYKELQEKLDQVILKVRKKKPQSKE